MAVEFERHWRLTELHRLNSPPTLPWTAVGSGKRCPLWEKVLLKVFSEAVLQHEMHILRCRRVLTIFFLLFFFTLVGMKVSSAISNAQAALSMSYCHIADFWAFFPIFLVHFSELLLAIRLLVRCILIFIVWEKLPVTSNSCRNGGLKAEVQPLHLQLSCNVPYCMLRALQMFLKSFLERKGMLLLSKQDTVACVQNSFQLLTMSASWICPRASHLWSCPSPDAEGNCGG